MAKRILFLILFLSLSLKVSLAEAKDDSLALTVTPPLMKMNMEPGESLATALKVVNNNSQPKTIYIKVVDFRGKGSGEVEFLKDLPEQVSEEDKKVYLSQWVTLNQKEVEIEPFRPAIIPFTIDIPKDAQPGGHYAAILVGTNPPSKTDKGAEIKVSSYISSLLLVRISGAVVEKGMIREFTFSNRFYQGGEGSFRVRFQNTGNVHLQPIGGIKVYDMFGKEKGSISVNNQKDFGNVLPNNERTWDNLKWSSDNFFLINRYRAELSLSYGEDLKQTDYQTFFFWGINLKWLIIMGFGLLVLFVLIIVFIKFYISQSVKNLKKQMGVVDSDFEISEKRKKAAVHHESKTGERKIIDLRKRK
jgi:hypothetical protein